MKRFGAIALAAVVCAVSVFTSSVVPVGVGRAEAVTQGVDSGYLTSAIADRALRYVIDTGDLAAARPGHAAGWGGNACLDSSGPDWNGQCKAFVNCVLKLVRGSADPNYVAGVQVPIAESVKGDIIQAMRNGVPHTMIVLSYGGSGNVTVVDSNWTHYVNGVGYLDETVQVHTVNVPNYFTGGYTVYRYGQANPANGEIAGVVGNWDGYLGDTVVAVADTPSGLQWFLRNYNSGGTNYTSFYFGGRGWIPVTGDWDGNGTTTIGAVARTSAGLAWHLRNANNAGPVSYPMFYYGGQDWVPVTGDWDGNGTTTIGAVARTSAGLAWHMRNANNAGPVSYPMFYYGGRDWVPVTGDWDGNGTTTIGAVARTSAGLAWYLRNANSGGAHTVPMFYYGAGGWTPVVGNWDSLGGDSIGAVARTPAGLGWYLRNSNNAGVANAQFYYGGENWLA